jgi:hypothetical protein
MQIYENFTTKFNIYKNLEEKLMKMNESFLNKINVNDYDPQKFMNNPNIEETFENRKHALTQYKKSANARTSSQSNNESKASLKHKNLINTLNDNNRSKIPNSRNHDNHKRLNNVHQEDVNDNMDNKNNHTIDVHNLFDNNQRLNQKIDMPFDFSDPNMNKNCNKDNHNNVLNNEFQNIFNAFSNNKNNNVNNNFSNANLNRNNNEIMNHYNYPLNINAIGNNRNANTNINFNNHKENLINYPNLDEVNKAHSNIFNFDFSKPAEKHNNKVSSDPNIKYSNSNHINNYNFEAIKLNEFIDFSTPQKSLSNQLEHNHDLNNNNNNFLKHNNSNFVNLQNINLDENNFYSTASNSDQNKLQKNINAAGESVFIDYNTVKLETKMQNVNLNNSFENSNLNKNALNRKSPNVNITKPNYPSLDSVLDDNSIIEFPPINSHRIIHNRAFFEPIENKNINNMNIIPNNTTAMPNHHRKVPIMLGINNADNKMKIQMQISPAKNRIMQHGSKEDFEKILKKTNSIKNNKAKDPFEGFY